jgi:hypothetical protein
MKNPSFKVAIFALSVLSLPLFGQVQNPSSGVYGITEPTALDSQLFLKNTGTAGIARWQSIGGNGAVINQVIADPVTGLARFGSISSAIDVDVFTSRNLFLSNDNGAGPTPRFTLSSNGKIGINTITPQKVFEVQTPASDTAAFGRTLAVGEWTGIQVGYLEPWNSFYRKSAIVFQRTDATAARGKLMLLNNTAADATSVGVNDARLTISDNGNVGVGTTAPSATLHVDVADGPIIRLSRGHNGNRFDLETNGENLKVGPRDSGDLLLASGAFAEGMRLKSNGNVGIGTSDPTATLHVQVASGPVIRLSRGNDGNRFDLESNGTDLILGPRDSGDLVLASGAFVEGVRLKSNGNVGIGVSNPTTKLVVNGSITCKEVIVTLNGFADFVFSPTYNLKALPDVNTFVKTYRHLPDFPSEKEVLSKGMSIGKMQVKLVQKIEELTLYAIEAEKKNKALEHRVEKLEALISLLRKNKDEKNAD